MRFSENSRVITEHDLLARKRAPATACGNYKPELRGNDAPKDPANVARAAELNYEYNAALSRFLSQKDAEEEGKKGEREKAPRTF